MRIHSYKAICSPAVSNTCIQYKSVASTITLHAFYPVVVNPVL